MHVVSQGHVHTWKTWFWRRIKWRNDFFWFTIGLNTSLVINGFEKFIQFIVFVKIVPDFRLWPLRSHFFQMRRKLVLRFLHFVRTILYLYWKMKITQKYLYVVHFQNLQETSNRQLIAVELSLLANYCSLLFFFRVIKIPFWCYLYAFINFRLLIIRFLAKFKAWISS